MSKLITDITERLVESKEISDALDHVLRLERKQRSLLPVKDPDHFKSVGKELFAAREHAASKDKRYKIHQDNEGNWHSHLNGERIATRLNKPSVINATAHHMLGREVEKDEHILK